MLGVKQTTLITLYCTVCDNHSIIEERMQRLSNNRFPKFSDEECITAYLWGKLEGRSTRKDVYNFIRDYWHGWFPKLPSYQAFCGRLNNLVPAFQALAEIWSGMLCAQFEESVQQYIIDSCPIILAKQSRSASKRPPLSAPAPAFCSMCSQTLPQLCFSNFLTLDSHSLLLVNVNFT